MIKQGYMVVIESYAGDMDDNNTLTLDGLTAMEAQWYHEVFNAWHNSAYNLNKCSIEDFVEVIKQVCVDSGYVPSNYSEYLNPDFNLDSIRDIAYDLFGAACEYTERIRTPSVFKMYNIPCDIPEISGSN